MATKIRLQRHGKKGNPFYWIVTVDSRSKRDGKFIEKLGTYAPIKNPAEITLNVDAAVKWLHNGAQPTETVKRLLSYKGALMKHHLEVGVRKSAMTQEQAEKKFVAWLQEKENKISSKVDGLAKSKESEKVKKLEAEKAYREGKIAEAVAEKIPSEEKVGNAEISTEEVAPEEATSETKVFTEETLEEDK